MARAISPAEHEYVSHLRYDASRSDFFVRTVQAPFRRGVSALRRRLDHQIGRPARPPSAPSASTRNCKDIVFVV